MSGAFLCGLFAGSSLLVGGLVALRFITQAWLGPIMAFNAGVLISALAYELVGEAFDTSAGSGGVALGLFVGAGAFFAGDFLIDSSAVTSAGTRVVSRKRVLRSRSFSGSSWMASPSRS